MLTLRTPHTICWTVQYMYIEYVYAFVFGLVSFHLYPLLANCWYVDVIRRRRCCRRGTYVFVCVLHTDTYSHKQTHTSIARGKDKILTSRYVIFIPSTRQYMVWRYSSSVYTSICVWVQKWAQIAVWGARALSLPLSHTNVYIVER